MSIPVDVLETDDERTQVEPSVLLDEINAFLERTSVNGHFEIGIEAEPIAVYELNAFPDAQTRKVYAGIYDLKESIKSDNLLHPLTVVELDLFEAQEYIDELNKLWGTNHTLAEQTQAQSGNYLVLIAGHRRLLAINEILADVRATHPDIDLSRFLVKANVMHGISLTEALKLQIAENTHQGLPPEQEAHSIRLYWERSGLSIRECSRDLGLSERKIREAIRFSQLPENIQDLVFSGNFSFTRAVLLHPLQAAYQSQQNSDGSPKYMPEHIASDLLSVVIKSLDGRWDHKTYQAHIGGLADAIGGGQLTIFDETLSDSENYLLSNVVKMLSTDAQNLDVGLRLLLRGALKNPGGLLNKGFTPERITRIAKTLNEIAELTGSLSLAAAIDGDFTGPPQDTSLFQA